MYEVIANTPVTLDQLISTPGIGRAKVYIDIDIDIHIHPSSCDE